MLGPDRAQQLPLQLLQWCLADRRPPGGEHCGRGHRVPPLPRHRGQLSQPRGEDLAVISLGHQRHQQHRPDGGGHAHLPPRHSLDLPGRADVGGDPVDRPRPAAAVQFLLRDPEPGVITRAALGWDPPVPAPHRGRHHHNLAPHHQVTGPDRCGPRDHQRRAALTARARSHRPAQRRHRHGHHHHPLMINTGNLHTGDRGQGRDRVERHPEAPRRRSASYT